MASSVEENKYFEVRRTYPRSRKLPRYVSTYIRRVIRMSRKPPDVHSDLLENFASPAFECNFFSIANAHIVYVAISYFILEHFTIRILRH